MKISVHITDTETAETRVYHDEAAHDEHGVLVYMWDGGNYGCDCNRSLFFARAANADEPDDLVCGAARYRVKVYANDGTLIFQDVESAE